ncbi:hypothetical protein H8R23_01965 [Flavobacterium sp. F-380]|uniref:Uncharacterized protein n=1 Tax=Flavobacterium kayseriense TaxID=2764714 RepID=A0ABR7J4L5_9FLAO|nr:hypothetical protein [Flavobacterium kayseriense]MBC5840157.1 hypothetical protein [Flavobacterium kayseriense]MBC5847173.1 hypothetical protein [Flavobacterium kayseriense]
MRFILIHNDAFDCISSQLLRIFLVKGMYFAPDGSGKPGGKKLFFLGIKERPQEAPFMTLEKKILREDLQRTAGLGSNYYF